MAAAGGAGAVAATAGAAAAGLAPAGRLPIMVIFSWAQCDKCSKWRRLPPGHEPSEDAFWECSMSPKGSFNTCEAAEEEMPENELAGEKLDAVMQQRKQHCRLRHNRCQNMWRQSQTLSGVKSYACKHEGCGKCFTLLDNLKRHEKSHPAKARREEEHAQQQREENARGYGTPTAAEVADAAALFNNSDPRLWPPQAVTLAHTLAPDVATKLKHFDEALSTVLAKGYAPRPFSAKLEALIGEIKRVVQPAILKAGERAATGLLPLCYTETEPEAKRQRALHRGLLALLILYSPLRRRQLGGTIELLAILRHVEMYVNADPAAVTPTGDLLTGRFHANQHAQQRELHAVRGHGTGGYMGFIAQRRGVGARPGATRPGTSGSVNIMTAGFNLCVRAFERVIGLPGADGCPPTQTQFLAEGGDMVDQLTDAHGETRGHPMDLIGGAMFLGCVDLRTESEGGDPEGLLELVLRAPVLLKRISVSDEGEGEGSPEQIRVRAQPQAEEALGFLRPPYADAFCGSVLARLGIPMFGTPVFCFDTVDYVGAEKQGGGKFKP